MIIIPVPLRGVVSRKVGEALAAIGGVLILLGGLLNQFNLPSGFYIGFAVGLAIVGLAAIDPSAGRFQPVVGCLVVVLAIIALFELGDFFFGPILGGLGGTILVLAPSSGWSSYRRLKAAPSIDLGPICPNCGHHRPPWAASCPYCAAGP